MNRRKFLVGGGIIGFVAAIAAAATGEDQKATGKVCTDGHDPHPSFVQHAAISIDHADQSNGPTNFNLVPCRRCGIFLAIPKKAPSASIYARGHRPSEWILGGSNG